MRSTLDDRRVSVAGSTPEHAGHDLRAGCRNVQGGMGGQGYKGKVTTHFSSAAKSPPDGPAGSFVLAALEGPLS